MYKLIRLYSLLSPFFMTLIACNSNNNSKDIRNWSDKETEEWYDRSPWSNSLPLKPDSSIDKRLLAEQIKLNPKSWDAAYKFIKESDFNNMEAGRYDLTDDGAYATIAEYQNKVSSRFEAHRKFVDIQMVSKGKEYVLVTSLDTVGRRQLQAYDDAKDIEFFEKNNYERRMLYPGNFMILFPANAHQPCLVVDTVGLVRKIVIKIPYAERK